LPPHKIARLGISRTFQNIRLFGYLTVLDNILIGRNIYFRAGIFSVIAGLHRKEYEKNREVAEEMIDFLDLKPYRYSLGRDIPLGVRKKVELARALVQMPKVLLLDEPTSGLTYEEKSEFLYYVKEINEKFGITLVVIEHDVKVISSIANRVVALDFGIKVAEGSSQEVLNHPRVIESYLGSF
jgi:ABC-type branched-chain amino acid transport systems, ATPase component